MFTSINQSRLKRLAVGIWASLALSMVLYLAQTSSTHYRAGTTVQSKPGNSTDSLKSQPAGPSTEAQFERRSVGSVSEGKSGTTGLYLDRFGLRYYREAYPGTDCFGSPLPEIMELDPICVVGGDFHADDIYFPSPKLKWA